MDIERAINELKVVGTLGDTLEFGFGIEDVVRLMAKSERGCVCLALCAALKECYSGGTYLFANSYKSFVRKSIRSTLVPVLPWPKGRCLDSSLPQP
jgi:hypothetical protein